MILFAPPISSCTAKAKWWFRELANRATLVRKSPQRLPVPAHRLFVHPAEALHGDLGMIESRDVMLFISYSGGAKELDLIIPRLEDKSIALLAMTGKPTSPLGTAAKAVLDISVEREACPMHLAPTSSTVNTLMMGDALAMAVMQARGFNEEDFARSHPAGALGARLLNKVHHLMRRDDAIHRWR